MKYANRLLGGSLCLAASFFAMPALAQSEIETKADSFVSKMEAGAAPTLEDMAEGQDVLAGLQLVLEIEKLRASLADVRRDRQEAESQAAFGGMPMGAGEQVSSSVSTSPAFSSMPAVPQIQTPTIAPVVAPAPSMPTKSDLDDRGYGSSMPSYSSNEDEIEDVDRPEVTVLKIMGAGGNFRAQVQDSNGEIYDVFPGDDLEGATIVSINGAGVRVDLGSRKVTLPLDLSSSKASFNSDY